jgi:predicted secreted protein
MQRKCKVDRNIMRMVIGTTLLPCHICLLNYLLTVVKWLFEHNYRNVVLLDGVPRACGTDPRASGTVT